MGFDISTPSDIVYNRELSHLAVRVYQIIRNNCSSDGYTKITNKTLANFIGEVKLDEKGEIVNKNTSSVSNAIQELVKHDYIVLLQHVKREQGYEKNYDRVVWLKESYLMYKDSKVKKEYFKAHAKPENDWNAFVNRLRDNANIPISIEHADGQIEVYQVHSDGKMYLHTNPRLKAPMLRTHVAKDVWDILFKNRYKVLKDPTALVREELTDKQQEIKDLSKRLAMLKKV